MTSAPVGPEQLARILLGSAVGLKRGENLIVETWTHTLPYAAACVTEAHRRGAHPLVLYEDEATYWRSLEVAPRAQVGRVGRHEWAALEHTDAYVFFPGPADHPRLQTVSSRGAAQLRQYNREWYRRARAARVRGVRSILGYASDPQAARWGVDGDSWREQLLHASVDVDIGSVQRQGTRVATALKTGRQVRVTAANGTDFTARLRGRVPYRDDGVVDADDLRHGRNMTAHPPGSVVVAVDEHSATGTLIGDRPSFLASGRVDGGQWEFATGRLTSYSFTDGQPSFEAAVEEAPDGWDQVSLLSVGLNPALEPGVPQVEDLEAGAVALAVGGNRFYGGRNSSPFVSWVVVGEATVAVDERPLLDRGMIL